MLNLVVLQELLVVRHQIDGVLHIEAGIYQKNIRLSLDPVYLADNPE